MAHEPRSAHEIPRYGRGKAKAVGLANPRYPSNGVVVTFGIARFRYGKDRKNGGRGRWQQRYITYRWCRLSLPEIS